MQLEEVDRNCKGSLLVTNPERELFGPVGRAGRLRPGGRKVGTRTESDIPGLGDRQEQFPGVCNWWLGCMSKQNQLTGPRELRNRMGRNSVMSEEREGVLRGKGRKRESMPEQCRRKHSNRCFRKRRNLDQRGTAGGEFLSASGYRRGDLPDLEKRRLMREVVLPTAVEPEC